MVPTTVGQMGQQPKHVMLLPTLSCRPKKASWTTELAAVVVVVVLVVHLIVNFTVKVTEY